MQEPDGRAGRPRRSWVMGRSARWHDPAFLEALEKAGAAEAATLAATVLGARSGGTRMIVHLVRRLLWARGRAPRPPAGR